jgi:hypothetical protein
MTPPLAAAAETGSTLRTSIRVTAASPTRTEQTKAIPNAAIYVRALMKVFSCMPKHTGGESRVKTLKVESETLNADIDLTIASTASFVISP